MLRPFLSFPNAARDCGSGECRDDDRPAETGRLEEAGDTLAGFEEDGDDFVLDFPVCRVIEGGSTSVELAEACRSTLSSALAAEDRADRLEALRPR
jgi:hypothetical protein